MTLTPAIRVKLLDDARRSIESAKTAEEAWDVYRSVRPMFLADDLDGDDYTMVVRQARLLIDEYEEALERFRAPVEPLVVVR